MIIQIDDIKYHVRHDFLHRGMNPRLVLNAKIKGKYLAVQFDNTTIVQRDIINNDFPGKTYCGYWCDAPVLTEIQIQIISK